MGTLSSELGAHLERCSGQPRVYADANVPAGLVSFMRRRLSWDVLFVLEHDDLRRAPDHEHYRLARQWRRTLLTLDRDYFNDRRFPPDASGGVIVVSAPDERALAKLLRRLDRLLFRKRQPRPVGAETLDVVGGPPLVGLKLHADVGWPGSAAR